MTYHQILGAIAIAYGLINLYLRRKRPDLFHKLEPMKRQFGDRKAHVIHTVAYSVVPVVTGLLLLLSE